MISNGPRVPSLGIGRNKWILSLVIGCCALVMTYMPDGILEFQYDRLAVSEGRLWRLLTAHLVHINTAHLLYNLLGLVLICELLWVDLPLKHGLGLLLTAALAISAALWWLQPEIVWYAGLSGALHGLWSGCALAGCWPAKHARHNSLSHRLICIAALVALSVKLYLDLLLNELVTMGISGISVVSSAHLHGAVTGIIYVMIWRLMQHCCAK